MEDILNSTRVTKKKELLDHGEYPNENIIYCYCTIVTLLKLRYDT